jgi:uncharacterized protein YjdB
VPDDDVAVSGAKTLPVLYLVLNKSATIPSAVQPYNAKDTKVSFTSANKKIATVDATGKVKGIKTGKTTITVTSNDGKKTARCTVYVVAKATKIKSLGAFKATGLQVGSSMQVKSKPSPAKATGIVPKYSSSNKTVAVIDATGVITALSPGATTIKVTAGNKSKTFKLTIGKVAPTKIVLDKKNTSLQAKKTIPLKVKTWTPVNTDPKKVTWTSSNKKIATVNSRGMVKGVSKGKVTITATTWNGRKASCRVTVK